MIHTKSVSLSIHNALLQKIDDFRGDVPRSIMVNNMLEYILNQDDDTIKSFLKPKDIVLLDPREIEQIYTHNQTSDSGEV